MAADNRQTPDLASILRTLSGLNSQNVQKQAPPPRSTTPTAEVPSHLQQAWQHELERASQHPRSTISADAQPKFIDPTSIIEWSAGLRCVMKMVAKHDNIVNEIRRVRVVSLVSYNIVADPLTDDQDPA